MNHPDRAMTAADDIGAYLDAVLSDTEGYLHTATGRNPYFNERGGADVKLAHAIDRWCAA